MNILITNDDGIYAQGMLPFVSWAKKLGNVYVFAPKSEQSGKSHGIDLHRAFEVKEIELMPGVKAWSVDSTPADCVRLAVLGFGLKFDLALSGINRGYNMGGDILYSGTMGAAREAAYLGVKAVAVSTVPAYYPGAVEKLDMVRDFFHERKLLSLHSLYNVNIPPGASDIRITRQGGPYFTDDFEIVGENMYKARGRCVYEPGEDLDIDTHCTVSGHISVSPISTDLTDLQLFNKLK